MVQQTSEPHVTIIPATRDITSRRTPRRRNKIRVAAYCRVSTDSEEQLNSYESQKRTYTQKIAENPEWEMAGLFADEGITGTSLQKRTEFNRMIAACKRGSIDIILTKSLSRFARNTVDCLETVRMLKARGIGVIFEKENIDTLTQSSEFIMTLFSGFAQAESESLSKNVTWGKQKSMEAGHVAFQYRALLGYQKGADGKPEIVESEAQIVRRIFRSYLDGSSLADIKRMLDNEGLLTARGVKTWSHQVIRNILTNEKYIGDALLQKTYITDCISKKVKKNRGERPMYYVENNHPAIIPRDVFQRVQEEMARRSSKRKVMQRTGKTEQGKYSSKYALSELLICGECGTPYKRCTWSRNGKKRIVWRCISRLEFGKKYCHNSPTIDEDKLQAGILTGLSRYAAESKELRDTTFKLASLAKCGEESDGMNMLILQKRLETVASEQSLMLDRVLEDMENEVLNTQLKSLMEEKLSIQKQIDALRQNENGLGNQASCLQEMRAALEELPAELSKFDDIQIRRWTDQITVVNAEKIKIRLRDIRIELEQDL